MRYRLGSWNSYHWQRINPDRRVFATGFTEHHRGEWLMMKITTKVVEFRYPTKYGWKTSYGAYWIDRVINPALVGME